MPVIRNQYTMLLAPEIHYKIKKISETENRSMTNMIEYLICKEIKRYEHENGEIPCTDDDIFSE